jgi:RNA polymerase sigma-70 factor (ECF subfamily)
MYYKVTRESTPWIEILTSVGKEIDDTLLRARKLDSKALAQIHDRYYPEVYRYVRFRLENQDVVEDITSEVFLRLLDALHRSRGPETSLRGWLLGTASNLVNDHLRRIYSRPVENLEGNAVVEELGGEDSPENFYEVSTKIRQVRDAIRKLTAEQQHVLALRFAEDRSLDETAQIVGKTVTAVKALQFRALASLRRLLDE